VQFAPRWAFRKRDWLLLVIASASLALAFLFAKFGSEVLERELATFDGYVREVVLVNRTSSGLAFFRIITSLGSKAVLIPLSVMIGWLAFRAPRHLLLLLLFTSLAATEFVAVLKRNFHVVRPAAGAVSNASMSFPSGHATGSAAVATLVAYVAVRRNIQPWFVASMAVLYVALVGISRVYLDVHWASDVLGGWVVGGSFGLGCCALYEWSSRQSPDRGLQRGETEGRV